MKAKQVLSMLLAVVMAGSLAACGNTSGNEQVQEKAGQSEQTERGRRQEYQKLRVRLQVKIIPLWQSTKTPGKFVRRNKDTFFFGLSLTAIIK